MLQLRVRPVRHVSQSRNMMVDNQKQYAHVVPLSEKPIVLAPLARLSRCAAGVGTGAFGIAATK